jgi:hypothetical protein
MSETLIVVLQSQAYTYNDCSAPFVRISKKNVFVDYVVTNQC